MIKRSMSWLRQFTAGILLLLGILIVTTSVASAAIYDPFQEVCRNPAPTVQGSAPCQADGSDPITGKGGILYKTSRIIAFITGVGAVIMIMYGGLMYQAAAGDESKATKARSIITAAVVGLVIIATAEVTLALVINLVE